MFVCVCLCIAATAAIALLHVSCVCVPVRVLRASVRAYFSVLFLGYRSAKLFMGDRALHVFTHRADHKEQHDARADLSCTLFHRG